MAAYLKVFINCEQNNWARLLPMAKFAYNNVKNAITSHIPFKLNYDFYPQVSFKDNLNLCSRSCYANELAKELRKQMDIYQQNLLHAQKL